MGKMTLRSITAEEREDILKKYADDVRLYYDEGWTKEWWIGESGSTTIKMLHWWEDGGEDNGEFIDFGETINELRKDMNFVRALVTNEDVNHGLDTEYDCSLKWLAGDTNVMPITACGAVNYFYSYSGDDDKTLIVE